MSFATVHNTGDKKNLNHRERLYSIDTFRLISIFFVILHHFPAFKRSYELYYDKAIVFKSLYYLFGNIRLLPFFFLAAGYFFGKSIIESSALGDKLWKYCGRLLKLYVAWSAIYLLFVSPNWWKELQNHGLWLIVVTNVTFLLEHPLQYQTRGAQEVLWFFPALISGIIISAVFFAFRREKFLIPLGILLYLIAILGKSYSILPIGYDVDVDMKQGPFVSTIFVGIGWLLAQKQIHPFKTGLILMIFGLAVQVTETLVLWKLFGMKAMHEYLLGTVPFCIGIFMMILSKPDFGKNTKFPEWGKLTLGIYVLHDIVINLFDKIKPLVHPIWWDFTFPALILVISLIITILMRKHTLTRPLVT